MKTKNIFNLLAMAMLMPAVLLTTACSSNDESIINNENTNKNGYPLQVTVNVTREGDATTRATYNDGTKKLSFSEGDQLYVGGTDDSDGGAGPFAGMLNYVSGGTFSGTIYTKEAYTGTFDALFTAGTSQTYAALLPAGYETYNYWSITDPGTYYARLHVSDPLNGEPTKAIATSKATAIEQFSLEDAEEYISGTGFALKPHNAILNFTISGLTTNTRVTATLADNISGLVSGPVTTEGSGNATFAMAVRGDVFNINQLTLTVGGINIPLTSTSKVLAAGHIYNIDRTSPAVISTVTWNHNNVLKWDNRNNKVDYTNASSKYEGITISFSGKGTYSVFLPYDVDDTESKFIVDGEVGDSFTFTAPEDKQFTKIEIYNQKGSPEFTAYGDYWTKPENPHMIVWSGNASSTATLGTVWTRFASLYSIVFTLIDK